MTAPITACLLHGDYHVMTSACWDVTTAWFFEHLHGTDEQRRDSYQAAVERRILTALRQDTSSTLTPPEAPHA